jgi:hypothetical protein
MILLQSQIGRHDDHHEHLLQLDSIHRLLYLKWLVTFCCDPNMNIAVFFCSTVFIFLFSGTDADNHSVNAAQKLLRDVALFQRQAIVSTFSDRETYDGWKRSVFSSSDLHQLNAQNAALVHNVHPHSSLVSLYSSLVILEPRSHLLPPLEVEAARLLKVGATSMVTTDNAVLQTFSDHDRENFTLWRGHFDGQSFLNKTFPPHCAVVYKEPIQRFQGCLEHYLRENKALVSHNCLDEVSLEDLHKVVDRFQMKAPHCYHEHIQPFSYYGKGPDANSFQPPPMEKLLRRNLRGEAVNHNINTNNYSRRAKFKRFMRMLQQQGMETYKIPFDAWNRSFQLLQRCEVLIHDRSESYALLAEKLPSSLRRTYNLTEVLATASWSAFSHHLESIQLTLTRKRAMRGSVSSIPSTSPTGTCPILIGEKRRVLERKLALEVLLYRMANEKLNRKVLYEQLYRRLPAAQSCVSLKNNNSTSGSISTTILAPDGPVQLITSRGRASRIVKILLQTVTAQPLGAYWTRSPTDLSFRDTVAAMGHPKIKDRTEAGECRADVGFLHTEAGLFQMRTAILPNGSKPSIDSALFDDFEDRLCRRGTVITNSQRCKTGQELLSALSKGVVVLRDPFLYLFQNVFKPRRAANAEAEQTEVDFVNALLRFSDGNLARVKTTSRSPKKLPNHGRLVRVHFAVGRNW